MTHGLVSLVTIFFLLSPIDAQRTIIVDWLGGAGSHYKQLDKAIMAAKDGDIILVRAGAYRWVTTALSKGITVQGVGLATRITGRMQIGRPRLPPEGPGAR